MTNDCELCSMETQAVGARNVVDRGAIIHAFMTCAAHVL